MNNDTICAIATAAGEGGIAIVRASGKGAKAIFEKCFAPAARKEIASHRMMYGFAVDEMGEKIDETMSVFLAAPHTYTREDMFEIQCHGGGVCARLVMERIISLGARIAEPGEFTRRAFMNGRIDLAKAEAVMSLIGANSETAARASMRQLQGGVSGFVHKAAEQLKDHMALIEACTDFPDEVEEEEAAEKVKTGVLSVIDEIEKRCDDRGAKLIREGASIVLAGRPNVGKSSLMNALLNQDRAIVTSIPGTTRDVLTERIRIGGVFAEISDPAGRRFTDDPVEKIGVDRAQKAADTADILLIVIDASEELTDEDRELLENRDERCIVILNKSDLQQKTFIEGAIEISAASGEGVDALMREMEKRISVSAGIEDKMTEERHLRLARTALDSLKSAVSGIDSGFELDLIEIDLKEALSALSQITGEDATEEVIDRVFSTFCVGK
ncbi:MAG: tRNA uridine-5-carboxymethylaminomethyl(34) synthesis GTPase MnmE [Clostridia bacterium]|nr:tRNA uridine-5-carboxymethylaminomethyl(34) synthesis GTPase MnmE [Clostridia bacterium]